MYSTATLRRQRGTQCRTVRRTADHVPRVAVMHPSRKRLHSEGGRLLLCCCCAAAGFACCALGRGTSPEDTPAQGVGARQRAHQGPEHRLLTPPGTGCRGLQPL